MKAIVITDNHFRGGYVNSLLMQNKQFIKHELKALISEGKARVDDISESQAKAEKYAKEWVTLGEIVFGKTEKVKVILI